MRILLDECVPWPLSQHLLGHACSNPQREGWAGIKNGQLLALAEGRFDVFVTSDQGLRYQQNLAGRSIAIIELSTNDWLAIKASAAEILAAIEAIRPAQFVQHAVAPL